MACQQYIAGEFIREEESELEKMIHEIHVYMHKDNDVDRYRIDDETEFQGDGAEEAGIVGGKIGVFVEQWFEDDTDEAINHQRWLYHEISDIMWAYGAVAVRGERF